MVHFVAKWKITVRFSSRENIVLWLSDDHLANVLRTIASLQFTENGLERPTGMLIELVA